jgi:hypothetical protein
MTCLTSEQLAAISLKLEGVERPSHLDHCPACQQKLADMCRLTDDLATSHAALNHNHAVERERLLARLSGITLPTRPIVTWKRFAFGGLGLSSAAAALLILAVFTNSSSQLSAMERIVNAVRDVSSFSYKLTYWKESPPTAEKPGRTLDCTSFAYWREPHDAKRDEFGDLRATQKNEAVYHSPTGDQRPVVLTDLIEIHPSGHPGILIDYVAKKYFRILPLHASDIATSTPLLWLRAVREKAGRIVADLGSREIGGREAHGYTMTFYNVAQFDDFGPVDVWIDPETDLPVEFCFRYTKADEEGFTDEYSVTDIQWNMELDPRLFDTTPPAGFLDVTIPNDEQSVAEVMAAIKLYAELSGGRYPHVDKLDDRNYATKFDAEACHREMLELAGFTGPPRDEWTSDPSYQRIQQSRAGLGTLERVLHNTKWLIGYYGENVGPQDKDKVLLWWGVAQENAKDDQYRLFYGDLRTEVVPRKKWLQFVPPEIAELTE